MSNWFFELNFVPFSSVLRMKVSSYLFEMLRLPEKIARKRGVTSFRSIETFRGKTVWCIWDERERGREGGGGGYETFARGIEAFFRTTEAK